MHGKNRPDPPPATHHAVTHEDVQLARLQGEVRLAIDNDDVLKASLLQAHFVEKGLERRHAVLEDSARG